MDPDRIWSPGRTPKLRSKHSHFTLNLCKGMNDFWDRTKLNRKTCWVGPTMMIPNLTITYIFPCTGTCPNVSLPALILTVEFLRKNAFYQKVWTLRTLNWGLGWCNWNTLFLLSMSNLQVARTHPFLASWMACIPCENHRKVPCFKAVFYLEYDLSIIYLNIFLTALVGSSNNGWKEMQFILEFGPG